MSINFLKSHIHLATISELLYQHFIIVWILNCLNSEAGVMLVPKEGFKVYHRNMEGN